MREFVTRLRRCILYSPSELLGLLFVSVVVGFCFSFTKWGYVQFDYAVGVFNLLRYSVYAFLVLGVMDIGRKYYASRIGMRSYFVPWYIGLVIALICCFATNGSVFLLFVHGFRMQPIADLQFGRKKGHFRLMDPASIAFFGIVFSLVLGMLLSVGALGLPHLVDALYVHFAVVLFSLLPLDLGLRLVDKHVPISNGTAIFLGSRTLAVFCGALVLLTFVGMFFLQSFWYFLIASLVAMVIAALYYYRHELPE